MSLVPSLRSRMKKDAKDRFTKAARYRLTSFIRGRGTTAIVEPDVCIGCGHCFDNCAFEAIALEDVHLHVMEHDYATRKAIILTEDCVGCEKCAVACPVDAIDMILKEGFRWEGNKTVPISTEAGKSG